MTNTKGKITLLICLVLSLVMMFVLSSCDNTGTSSSDSTRDTESNTDWEYISVTDVYFEESEISLEIGEQTTNSAIIVPYNATNRSLYWYSSNPTIVSVENGIITAHQSGTASITVEAENGISASYLVTVEEDNSIIEVSQITLDKDSITMNIGETEELVATVSPWNANDTSLTYSSSNNSVAVVQDGKIYALGEGVALITVTASNGKQANCIVTVNKKAVEDDTPSTPLPDNATVDVSEVVLNSSNIELDEGDTYTLTATIYPSNATDKTIVWKSSSSSVATVDNGIVKAVSSGTATITATASNGVSASCTVKVSEKLYFVFEEYGSGYTVVEYIGTSTNVTIPSTYNGKKVIAIGNESGNKGFYKNYDIVSVVLPDTIKEINAGAFYNCGSLESITIPSSVTTIVTDAFSGSTNIKNATLPAIAMSYIPKDSLQTVVINGGNIGNSAFSDCTSLTSVTIGDSVTSIGSYAFDDCTSLTSVTIGDSVTSIGSYAFDDCTSLTSVIIGDSVTSIGARAFYGCTSLTSITIPNSVTSIGSYAFSDCTSLTEINFNATAMEDFSSMGTLFDNAGAKGNGIKVTIGKNVTKIPANLFDFQGSSYLSKITSVTFEEGSICKSIGEDAFNDCTSLTSITIPNSVTSIGARAFFRCTSLTSVTIPNSVTSIGSSAFSDCTSLTSVNIPNSVTSIGGSAFRDCTSLTSVTIGDRVTTIGNSAFYGCTSLTSITIPNSVTSIGRYAFCDCTKLAAVTFENTIGWYTTKTEGATSGTYVAVANSSTNATNLKSTYCNDYWYRK